MSFSPSTIRELEQELERILRERASLDARANAIEAIIGPRDRAVQTTLPITHSGTTTGLRPFGAPQAKPTAAGSPVNNGLRAAILDALRRAGGRERAPKLAAMLAETGFDNGSSTPLATRVYNDLWRMSQKGILSSDNGVFSLPKEGTH